MFPHWKSCCAAAACVLMLAGCASLAPAPKIQASVAPRIYHDTIELAGRLSVRYQKDGKEESLHGSFTWSQTPQRTLITMLSPLGQTLATIELKPGSSTLIQAGRAPLTAPDADTLAAQAFGWPLPVSGLRDWLQGFAIDSSGRPFIATPQSENSTVTTLDGWRIHYLDGQDQSAAVAPKRIDLQRSGTQAGEVIIRIIIDSRQVPN